ncbi:MAG TPA: Ppx/GppA family phosphatase [Sphingomicrobium sp.]|nr:Ppx/GppA family phosphatase [Sphingomicrobium sp.]
MATANPVAIIDIGSNSVRLVVYAGPERIPTPIFNEKVLAGLGSGLEQSGALSEKGRERTLAALRRYKLLIDQMKVGKTYVLATAAIRDARDGAAFVREIEQIGLDCEVLSATEEARLAGEGVLSGIPDAEGIVGDLGGGSLELVDVRAGVASGGISMPLGVLRLDTNAKSEQAARDQLKAKLDRSDLRKRSRGRTFYMIGGSWRALARIDMIATDFPLPVTHQYWMKPGRARELRNILKSEDPALAKAVAPPRLATSPVAAMLLDVLVEELKPARLVISSFGIREGLLYSKLDRRARSVDPLTEAARAAGGGEHRFGQHGDLLDAWIAPLFDDAPDMRRLRLASCLLSDVAWQATAPFRADRGIEMALHGNWAAVDALGRVMMAQALSASFGREGLPYDSLGSLCSASDLERARHWGLAMRLGQRLSGGVGSALQLAKLRRKGPTITLSTTRSNAALIGPAVKKRLAQLADEVGLASEIIST